MRDIHRNPVKQKLVQSMIKMYREMGIQVIAEGIEVAAEGDALVGMGCNLLQGYLFARPGPPFPDVSF